MKFIAEAKIESVIEQYYEGEEKFYADRKDLMNGQPAYSALLTDEGFELLSDDEYELLWFISTVIHTSIIEECGEIKAISLEGMEEIDEANWTIMEDATSTNFRERLSPFFDGYSQEDLLAFVEDSLESDEDISVSPAGRELIFVASKTLIDSMISMA
jgi:hypothetical protein